MLRFTATDVPPLSFYGLAAELEVCLFTATNCKLLQEHLRSVQLTHGY